jgi:MraZ protein
VESEIFQGNALSAVDGKSRLSIPAFIRNVLAPAEPRHVHLTAHGRAPCLMVHGDSYSAYLVAEQERLRLKGEDNGADLDAFDDLERGLWGISEKVNCDAGGRIVLGGLLRDCGRIEDMALFVGRGRYAELWNPRVAAEVGGDKLKLIASFYLKQRGAKA